MLIHPEGYEKAGDAGKACEENPDKCPIHKRKLIFLLCEKVKISDVVTELLCFIHIHC